VGAKQKDTASDYEKSFEESKDVSIMIGIPVADGARKTPVKE